MKKTLDRLRNESGRARLDWAELVLLGAKEKIRQIERDRVDSRILRKNAADQISDANDRSAGPTGPERSPSNPAS
ncbi:MAG: hypothetical protein ACSLFI_05375 [Solirubrobacterales bacterium]